MTTAASLLETSLDEFMDANGAALEAAGVPRRLWPSVWGRIEAGKLGSVDPVDAAAAAGDDGEGVAAQDGQPRNLLFDLALVNDVPCVVAARNLTPRAAVVVFPHEWVFADAAQAREHLAASPALVSACVQLITNANTLAGRSTPAFTDGVAFVAENLHTIAFSYSVAGLTPDGELRAETVVNYCVVSDPFGPAVIPEAKDSETATLSCMVLVDQRTMKGYTVLYPGWIKSNSESDYFTAEDDEEDMIPKSYVITRGPLQPLGSL
ncbi:hypothetical protein HDU84_001233 [Entophlyctis sp. JEL0112]|nr:hypothetical protein HDU84_001233 [Entophlyctis sp. JEL0112]